MTFNFTTKVWKISGEKSFEGQFTLLNPAMKIAQMVVRENTVYLQLVITENGGIFNHQFNVQYENSSESDLDIIADAAMAQAFPEAVLQA